jgi:hypothetical protein
VSLRDTTLGFRQRERFAARLRRLDLPFPRAVRVPISDDDLSELPEPARRYLRFMGVVGRPPDRSLRARFRGQFRMKPDQRWMPFDAWQYNSVAPIARIMTMRIDVGGVVPMFGEDTYLGGRGRMYGKLLGVVPVADGTGREFDLGELVTWVNDAAMLAPSMLLAAGARGLAVPTGGGVADGRDRSFDVEVSDGDNTVRARLTVDEQGRLTFFSTDDRWYAGSKPPRRARWSTPIDGWTSGPGRPLPIGGCAVWDLPAGDFAYVRGRFVPDSVEFDVAPDAP